MADVALAHLVDPASGEYNLPYLQQFFPAGAVVVTLFHRDLGLLVSPGNPLGIRTVADLGRRGTRLINRQEGSGTRWYLDQELARLGLEATQFDGYRETVATHLEVGLYVLRREVDVGIATHATARLLGLDFVPLTQERFEMLIPAQRFFARPATEAIAHFVGADINLPGTVHIVDRGIVQVTTPVGPVEVPATLSPGTRVTLCLRPEDLTLHRASQAPLPSSARNIIAGTIIKITPWGVQARVTIDSGMSLTALVTWHSIEELGLQPGQPVLVTFKVSAVHIIRHHEQGPGAATGCP